MRAVTNRYSLHPISGSLCGNTKDFTSPLGIRREAGVRPGANPYLSAIASPDADSFNCSGSKSRPSLMTRQTFPSLRIVRKRIGINPSSSRRRRDQLFLTALAAQVQCLQSPFPEKAM
jgi:hypothetical protein